MKKNLKVRPGPAAGDLLDDQDLGMFSSDDDPALKERYATFKSLWSKVFDVYTKVLHQNFAEIIEKVGHFVSNAERDGLDSMGMG